MKQNVTSTLPTERHPAPNLLFVVLAYTALMVLGGSRVVASFSIPHDSAATAVSYVAAKAATIQWGAFLELGSAIALGVFIAAVVSRLRFLGVRVAGESIALLGGSCATVMLLLSALSSWSLTRPGVAGADGAVRALQALGYVGGGPGFAVPLGLFLAGVSLSAGLPRLIPRWLMAFGLLIALACELASVSLMYFPAGYLIPVARFGSILWMIAVAFALPAVRPAASSRSESDAA